jgi:hypothetical protein
VANSGERFIYPAQTNGGNVLMADAQGQIWFTAITEKSIG